MSKTTFEPKAKTMSVGSDLPQGADPKKETADPYKDIYSSHGASQWKALTSPWNQDPLGMPQNSPLDYIGGVAASTGYTLGNAISNGPFGEFAPPPTKAQLQLGKKVITIGKDEYLKYFQTAEELFPEFADIKDLLTSTGSYKTAEGGYEGKIELCKQRLAIAEKAIKGGLLSPYQVKVMRQFIKKLNEGINFFQRQLELSKEAKTGGV